MFLEEATSSSFGDKTISLLMCSRAPLTRRAPGLQVGKIKENGCRTSSPIFLEVHSPLPPSRGVSSYFIHKWEGHCVRSSLRRPWNLCLRLAAWSKPRMFGEESLGKIKFRAFRKCVDHGFYRLKAFITLEQVNTTECGRIKTRMLISKTAMVSLRSWRYCVVVEWDLAVEPL